MNYPIGVYTLRRKKDGQFLCACVDALVKVKEEYCDFRDLKEDEVEWFIETARLSSEERAPIP